MATGTIIVGGITAGVGLWNAYQQYQQGQAARRAAGDAKDAQQAYQDAVSRNAQQQYKLAQKQHEDTETYLIRQEKANRRKSQLARRELQNAMRTAEKQYDETLQTLEHSRQKARMDIIRETRGTRNIAASYGSRGGSAFGQIERKAGRVAENVEFEAQQERDNLRIQMESKRENYDIARGKLYEADYAASLEIGRAKQQNSYFIRRAGMSKNLAEAGVVYQNTMADINYDAVRASTQYSAVTGALQGINTGLQLGMGITDVVGLIGGSPGVTRTWQNSGGGYGPPSSSPYGYRGL